MQEFEREQEPASRKTRGTVRPYESLIVNKPFFSSEGGTRRVGLTVTIPTGDEPSTELTMTGAFGSSACDAWSNILTPNGTFEIDSSFDAGRNKQVFDYPPLDGSGQECPDAPYFAAIIRRKNPEPGHETTVLSVVCTTASFGAGQSADPGISLPTPGLTGTLEIVPGFTAVRASNPTARWYYTWHAGNTDGSLHRSYIHGQNVEPDPSECHELFRPKDDFFPMRVDDSLLASLPEGCDVGGNPESFLGKASEDDTDIYLVNKPPNGAQTRFKIASKTAFDFGYFDASRIIIDPTMMSIPAGPDIDYIA